MNDPSRTARDIVNRMRNRLAEQQRPSVGRRPGTDKPSTPTGTGEALGGRVRVTVSEGRISEVTLEGVRGDGQRPSTLPRRSS